MAKLLDSYVLPADRENQLVNEGHDAESVKKDIQYRTYSEWDLGLSGTYRGFVFGLTYSLPRTSAQTRRYVKTDNKTYVLTPSFRNK